MEPRADGLCPIMPIPGSKKPGQPASIDAARVRELKGKGLGASEIAKVLKIGRASVYRVLDAG